VKVLPDHLASQPETRARFEREAKTVSSLNHPNICTLFDVGTDLEPLRRYSAELIAPFEGGGDPLPGWYRAATERIPCVRFVFSNEEAAPAEAVLARHLEQNVLGDRFTEDSYVTEPVAHGRLPEPALVNRYVESVIAELASIRG